MNKVTSIVLLFFVVSFTYGQYTVVTTYPGLFNCTGQSTRVEYRVNASCVEEGCVSSGETSRYLSCGSAIPQTPGTVAVNTYENADCTGDLIRVGVTRYPQNRCIVGSTGNYTKMDCNGTYTCTDVFCKDCSSSPLPSCTPSRTSGAFVYVCYPPSPSSSTTSSPSTTSGCLSSHRLSFAAVVLSFFLVAILL